MQQQKVFPIQQTILLNEKLTSTGTTSLQVYVNIPQGTTLYESQVTLSIVDLKIYFQGRSNQYGQGGQPIQNYEWMLNNLPLWFELKSTTFGDIYELDGNKSQNLGICVPVQVTDGQNGTSLFVYELNHVISDKLPLGFQIVPLEIIPKWKPSNTEYDLYTNWINNANEKYYVWLNIEMILNQEMH